MKPVLLKPIYHKEAECIGIYFEKDVPLQSIIQKHTGAKWSKTKQCWYIPLSKTNYDNLAKSLKGKAELKVDELRKYLIEKKKGVNTRGILKINSDKPVTVLNSKKETKQIKQQYVMQGLSKENTEALKKFKQILVIKSYSSSTIRTYTNEFVQFLNTIKEKPAESFTTLRIKDYLQYCFEKLHLSENTLHSRINALKFYYEQV